jgi:gliding motility-associated-like protein
MRLSAMLHKYFPLLFIPLMMTSHKSIAQEICNNGVDDDNDGLIDLFDPDCQCRINANGNLLLNGSFESYLHCPVNYTYDDEHNIILNWEFSTYTNDNQAIFYHNLHCARDSGQVMLYMKPAMPLPEGSGFISIYNIAYLHPIPENEMTKNYVSQCLAAPLTKGEDYTLSFYAGRFRSWDNFIGQIYPFNVAVFGNADCNAVPFGKKYAQGNGCPANYPGWVLLGATTLYSSGEWVQGKVHLNIPHDINVIAIGPTCEALPPVYQVTDSTSFLDYYLYYLDDMQLLPTKDFPFEYIHVQAGRNCNGLPVLEAPVTANASYQWYKDSIAIKGATNTSYQAVGTTTHYYNVLITTNEKCITSEPLLVTQSKVNKISIPPDTTLCGDDTLLLSPALDGVQYIINGTISRYVAIDQEGSYTITATDGNGCQKVFNTHVVKQNCADCNAYVPGAFTPNGDGLNDVFKAKLACFASSFHFRIFDRWGKQVFESSDIHQGWDGTYKGRKVAQGAYVYIINYKTALRINKTARGVVVLMQ